MSVPKFLNLSEVDRFDTERKTNTLEAAVENGSRFCAKSDSEVIVYQAVKVINTEVPPVSVKDIK